MYFAILCFNMDGLMLPIRNKIDSFGFEYKAETAEVGRYSCGNSI